MGAGLAELMKGRVESGTRAELVARQGRYTQLLGEGAVRSIVERHVEEPGEVDQG